MLLLHSRFCKASTTAHHSLLERLRFSIRDNILGIGDAVETDRSLEKDRGANVVSSQTVTVSIVFLSMQLYPVAVTTAAGLLFIQISSKQKLSFSSMLLNRAKYSLGFKIETYLASIKLHVGQ